MIDAGRLRHELSLQKRIKNRTESGEQVYTWKTYSPVRAEVKNVNGDERIFGLQIIPESTHAVITHYRDDVDVKDRFIFGTRRLNVILPVDPTGERRELVCFCREE